MVRVAAIAASSSAPSSHLEPLRVRAGAAFAGGLVVAGALPGPGGQVPGGGEAAHVGADLGDDAPRRCGAATPVIVHSSSTAARERARSAPRSRPRAARSARRGSRCARGSRRSSSAWWRVEAALQRLAQRRDLLAQLALGQVGEHLGVGRARRPARRASRGPDSPRMSRGDAVELDAGVLQRLVQPVGLALALLDLRLAIARQVAQLADRLGRHEARAQQPGLHSWHSHAASETSVLRPGTTSITDCMSCARRCRRR